MHATFFSTLPDDPKETILRMLAHAVEKSKRDWSQFQALALSDKTPLSALTHRLFNSLSFKDGGAWLEFDIKRGDVNLSSDTHESLLQVVLSKCGPFHNTLALALTNNRIESYLAMTDVLTCTSQVKRLELVWHVETSNTVATLFDSMSPRLEQLSIKICGVGSREARSKLLVYVGLCTELTCLEVKCRHGSDYRNFVVELLKIAGEYLEEVDLHEFDDLNVMLLHALREHCRRVKRLALPSHLNFPRDEVVSLCTFYGARLRKLKMSPRGLSFDNVQELLRGCANVRVALTDVLYNELSRTRWLRDRLDYLHLKFLVWGWPGYNDDEPTPRFDISQLTELHVEFEVIEVPSIAEILPNEMPRLRILSIDGIGENMDSLCEIIAKRITNLESFTLKLSDLLRDGKPFKRIAKSNPHLQRVSISDDEFAIHFLEAPEAPERLSQVYEEVLHSFACCVQLSSLTVRANGVVPVIDYTALPARIRSTEICFETHKIRVGCVQHEDGNESQ